MDYTEIISLLCEEKIQEYCIFQIINKIRMNKG